MEEVLSGLNEEQRAAVTMTEGYVRVIAGAGSGKTKALTHRYAYLVNELGISTSNILCVTFTNKAANEMKKRIRNMIGGSDTGYVCTFHGFCVQVLREDIHTIHYPKNFTILDTEDVESLLKTVYETCHISVKDYTFDMARKDITFAKSKNRHIPYLLELDNTHLKEEYDRADKLADKIFLGYLYEQKKMFGLDFEDLITITEYIFDHFEEKRCKWQERLMYIMVDEFQDVSRNQYHLADVLSRYHKNLFIVGDPDQTIYTWRGAEVNYILDFEKQYENVKTIILNKNYRSTANILDVSNSLIRKNTKCVKKDLIAVKEPGNQTSYFHARTVKQEAQWIAEQIEKLVGQGCNYKDMAILYRSHFVSRSIEEVFIRRKIRYILYSGVEFYKRKEIKDCLCYLRMIACQDDISFKRVINEPRRSIGRKRMSFLQEYTVAHNITLYQALQETASSEMFTKTKAADFLSLIEKYRQCYQDMRVSELLTAVLSGSGYEEMLRLSGEQERLDNLAELKQSVYDFENTSGEETTLEEYLQRVALFTNADKEERQDSVKMMTIHTAKGLEFPYVFVCGLDEGIFPSKHVDTLDDLEEERRLAYVACTRAEKGLFLSDAEGMNYDGSYRYPSRFLFDIDRKYLNYIVELEEGLMARTASYIQASEERMKHEESELQAGDRVLHKVFGEGTIVAVKQEINSYAIKFDSMETLRNIQMKTPLKRI